MTKVKRKKKENEERERKKRRKTEDAVEAEPKSGNQQYFDAVLASNTTWPEMSLNLCESYRFFCKYTNTGFGHEQTVVRVTTRRSYDAGVVWRLKSARTTTKKKKEVEKPGEPRGAGALLFLPFSISLSTLPRNSALQTNKKTVFSCLSCLKDNTREKAQKKSNKNCFTFHAYRKLQTRCSLG